MAELNYKADLNDTQEQTFEPIPADEYIAIITDSDFVDTKAGTGKYLKLTYEIIDGEYKGKKIFENLNLINPNKQAEAIARRSLNAICAACDIIDVQDSALLHNIPLLITVGIRENDQYGKQNFIKKHLGLQKEVKEKVSQEPPKPEKKAGKEGKHPWEK